MPDTDIPRCIVYLITARAFSKYNHAPHPHLAHTHTRKQTHTHTQTHVKHPFSIRDNTMQGILLVITRLHARTASTDTLVHACLFLPSPLLRLSTNTVIPLS